MLSHYDTTWVRVIYTCVHVYKAQPWQGSGKNLTCRTFCLYVQKFEMKAAHFEIFIYLHVH